jgi:glycosyltransferase involved in cell wall biosynthesis
MPLISVIIPAYNAQTTIQKTIESVLNQTFTDFELLVIDDGSQDATLEVVERISDQRLKVFSYPNAGVSATRNRGLAKATGELITFLDADDLWTPDKLEAQLDALKANPQAAVAYSWTDYIDECDRILYPGAHVTANGDVYTKLLLSDFLENGSNALIRREALIDVGGFDEALCGPEDWDLFLRLAAKYQFVAVPRPQILYRLSTNSISFNLARQEAQCLKVLEREFDRVPASLAHLKQQSLANLYQYLLFRGLAGSLDRQIGLTAARCLVQAVRHDLSILKTRSRLMAIVSLKIMAAILLPPHLANQLLEVVKNRPKNTQS